MASCWSNPGSGKCDASNQKQTTIPQSHSPNPNGAFIRRERMHPEGRGRGALAAGASVLLLLLLLLTRVLLMTSSH